MVDDACLPSAQQRQRNPSRIGARQLLSVSCGHTVTPACAVVADPVRWCCSEERHCRFCQALLPDWKDHMQAGSKQATPYMRVSFNGRTHKVPVKPGEQGQKEFSVAIRKLLNLPEDQEFDVSV